MSKTVGDVLVDLVAEQDSLDEVVAGAADEQWDLDTASPRWRIKEQIAHLAYFDNTAAIAISSPDEFAQSAKELAGAMSSGADMDEVTLGYAQLSATELLAKWRQHRAELATAAQSLSDDDRVQWYGPSMGSKSFLTARLMEAWAHGQDVVDALGIERSPTDRLAHIAQLGFITRGWTYKNRRLEVPDVAVSAALTSPSGQVWNYGDADAAETVTGSAEDFCLVTTQRRHLDDTELVVVGESAREWLTMAQAFAGPATDGPAASG